MVEMTQVLMERKADYSQALGKATHGIVKEPVVKNHKPLLNGDLEFLGRQNRSSSECSSDSNLEMLLEEADKIHSSKNGFRKDTPAKKQVRFNMERNQEYSYSYSQTSDDDTDSHNLMSNINFVDYGYDENDSNDDDNDDTDDDDDDDEDDDDDDEEGDDHNDPESSEDDSKPNIGFLVDKSNCPSEINNNGNYSSSSLKSTKINGTTDSPFVNGISNKVGEKLLNGTFELHDIKNNKLNDDTRLIGLKAQVFQLESSLKAKQDSVEKEMFDLNSRMTEARDENRQEMDKLEKELEARRRQYMTEMEDIDRRREEKKRKFEEELEEFRNEKKLEERRQRYYEHESAISQMEKDLKQRAQEVRDRDKEIREYEEYLNRRHAVCNGKEEDLNVLQNELDTLAKELESKKAKLTDKHHLVHQSSEESIAVSTPPTRVRSTSRASVSVKGVDLRIEELKSQNRQLLEELFSLKKSCENKDDELNVLKEKLEASENENKRLQQRTKHLETQLDLARKSAELGADSVSVDEIMRKTTQDMRSARNSRIIRPSRSVAPAPGSSTSTSAGVKPRRFSSNDSLGTKITSSSDSGKGTKESAAKSSKGSLGKKGKDNGDGRHKMGTEKITSALCAVM